MDHSHDDVGMKGQLDPLRSKVAGLLVGFIWLHVPLVALTVWALDASSPGLILLTTLAIAGAVTLLWKVDRAGPAFRYTVSAGSVGIVALLVAAFDGHPWQVDIHMYFFAMLAIGAVMCDWRATLVAAAAVAVHHLALNYIAPTLVFPDGTDFLRVVLHAVILVAETVALVWMITQIQSQFENADHVIAQRTSEALASARAAEASAARSEASLGEASAMIDMTQRLRGELDAVIGKALQGDFSGRVGTDHLQGAFEGLAGGMNKLVVGVDRAVTDVVDMLAAMAQGDLEKRITTDYEGKFGELKINANQTADQLAAIVGQIRTATNKVDQAAAEISGGTADLSARTEQAAADLKETKASAEQMAATVKHNAESAKNADHLADRANQTADSGGKVVEQAVVAMSGIEDSALKITDIISVIDEIAFQTNLLALNASVEAARAGEAGKGFAVVAQEVRQLAQRSATAASDIKTLIQNSNDQVKDGVQLVNRAGEALGEIVGAIGKVTDIVREISEASQEQASRVQMINASISGMDQMTQQNATLVDASTTAAQALSDQAVELTRLMNFFDPTSVGGADDTFKGVARTASSRVRSEAGREPAVAAADSGWDDF